MYLFAKTTLISRSLCLLVILAASSAVEADVFVDIPGVIGEAQDVKHKNWVSCDSARFSVVRQASSSESKVSSAPKFSEITLTRRMDVSSPDLFIRVANGQIAPEAVIEFTDSTGAVYLRLVLRDVAVTGYSFSASDEAITEEIRVTYSTIAMTYIVNDGGKNAGQLSRTWDVARNIEL